MNKKYIIVCILIFSQKIAYVSADFNFTSIPQMSDQEYEALLLGNQSRDFHQEDSTNNLDLFVDQDEVHHENQASQVNFLENNINQKVDNQNQLTNKLEFEYPKAQDIINWQIASDQKNQIIEKQKNYKNATDMIDAWFADFEAYIQNNPLGLKSVTVKNQINTILDRISNTIGFFEIISNLKNAVNNAIDVLVIQKNGVQESINRQALQILITTLKTALVAPVKISLAVSTATVVGVAGGLSSAAKTFSEELYFTGKQIANQKNDNLYITQKFIESLTIALKGVVNATALAAYKGVLNTGTHATAGALFVGNPLKIVPNRSVKQNLIEENIIR
ncbi:MAG: hypothetical protein ACXWL5_03245 [Candidatus Chromulinivorax sp.]